MARTCTVCTHPKREEIDAALVAQEPIRDIAGRTGTTKSALDRHRQHVAAGLVKAKGAKEEARAETLLDTIRGLAADAHRIRAKAEEAEDLRTALDAIGKLTKIVELLVKLRAESSEDAAPLHFVVTMSDGRISSHREVDVPAVDVAAPSLPPAPEEPAPAADDVELHGPARRREVRPYVPPPPLPPAPVAAPRPPSGWKPFVPRGGFDF